MTTRTRLSLKNDLIRILIFVIAIAMLVWVDLANVVVLQAVLIGTVMALSSHLTRRVLFPNLDVQLIALEAMRSPIGAAIVFASICAVLVAIMHVGLAVLK